MTHIDFDEEKHIYSVDGEEKPGVTAILSYITASHYGSINEAVLRQAALKGSEVHEACQLIDYGLEVEVDPQIAPYVRAYCDFLNDYNPQWEDIEQRHYCQGGDFCGTVDRMGYIDGKRVVLDLKTTASPTKENYVSYTSQLFAYSLFYDDWAKMKRYILFLKKDGKYRLVDADEYERKHNYDGSWIFGLCLQLYKKMKEVKNGK